MNDADPAPELRGFPPEASHFADLAAAASWYERELGWAAYSSRYAVWVRAWHEREAVCLPPEIATRAVCGLPASAPVLYSPGPPARCHVLCLPSTYRDVLRDWLDRPEVRHVWGNQLIYLPPTQWGTACLRWLTPPATPLPMFAELATASCAALPGA